MDLLDAPPPETTASDRDRTHAVERTDRRARTALSGLGPVEPLPTGIRIALTIALLAMGGIAALSISAVADQLWLGLLAVVVLGSVVTAAVLATTRFWWLVIGLVAIRSSLDALKASGYSTGAFDPGVLVGAGFVITASLWLLAQWRAGALHKFSGLTRAFGLFSAACVLSAAGSVLPFWSLQSASKVIAGFLMFAVLEQAFKQNPDRIRPLLAAAGVALMMPAGMAFYQLAGGGVQDDQFIDVTRIHGTFIHPNSFAMYLVMTAMVALALVPHLTGFVRIAAIGIAGLSTVLTVFTYARGAWVALVLGLIIIGVTQSRWVLAALLVGGTVAILAVPSIATRLSDLDDEAQTGQGNPNSLDWRYNYWLELLPQAVDSPVTGVGFDTTVQTSEHNLQPHNSWVQAIVETGLLGFTCLVSMVLFGLGRLRKRLRELPNGFDRGVVVGASAAGAGIALQLMTENLLSQAVLHWYLAVPLAFALSDVTTSRGSSSTPSPITETAEV